MNAPHAPLPSARATEQVLAGVEALRATARARPRARPKGRVASDEALTRLRELIGTPPPEGHARDLLIEHLHALQDACGGLPEALLVALAQDMRLSVAEVYEVASFYHHFDLLRKGEEGAGLTLRVCDGLSCTLQGAQPLLRALRERLDGARLAGLPGPVRVRAAPCVGRCEQAPAVQVGQVPLAQGRVDRVDAVLDALRQGEGIEPPGARCPDAVARAFSPLPPWPTLTDYLAGGGYRTLQALRAEGLAPGEAGSERALAALERGGLRGLGGAGFAAARKWRIVRGFEGPRLMVVNIDEGEPGTFKDRWYLERDPHRMLEGLLIAAAVVGCETVYLYLRDEYHHGRRVLQAALAELQAHPPGPLPRLVLRRGAGAYICGEESALLESLEGRRGEPRLRPPYIAERGLFGRPTLAHNFETLHWVRELIETGGARFAEVRHHDRQGLRSYSVSGRVREPGVKLAPAGITLRELIDRHCGGMAEGHTLYAYLPGGASGGLLPAHLADLPLDFDTLQPHGCFIGSAAVVVLSQADLARDAALQQMRFFADESCGQCTPCRVGTAKAAALMEAPVWDRATLEDLCAVMADASICGLGQAAPQPVRGVLAHFAHEVDGRDPAVSQPPCAASNVSGA